MSLVKWGFIGLFLLPLAEMGAFVAVALAIGWIPTACLFLATSILGLLILRRSGRGDLDRFRDAFRRDGLRAIHLESPGLGPILGGILLLFPGFITDLLGASLLVPAIRRRLRGLIARARETHRRQRDPSVIDLTRKEWHQVSEKPIKEGRPRKRVR
ncbi:MAG: FxsA family protein [Xanthobacteraceae bacterium]|nr:FxsA family protein [Xanthobacteraceae bacterium]